MGLQPHLSRQSLQMHVLLSSVLLSGHGSMDLVPLTQHTTILVKSGPHKYKLNTRLSCPHQQ